MSLHLEKKRDKPKGLAPGLLSLRVDQWRNSAAKANAALRRQPRGPSHHESPSEEAELPHEAATDGRKSEQLQAAALGILIHAYMACMQQDENDLQIERLETLEPLDEKLRDEAAEILRAWLRSDLADRFAQSRILGRELPLLYRDAEGGRWQGSMDLVLEENGEIIVVDFKSDRVQEEQIPARAAVYQDQIRIYAEALQAAWQLDQSPHRELWFLRPCVAHRCR